MVHRYFSQKTTKFLFLFNNENWSPVSLDIYFPVVCVCVPENGRLPGGVSKKGVGVPRSIRGGHLLTVVYW
jgi:hypothetical protein